MASSGVNISRAKLNMAGVNAILNCEEVAAELQSRAERICSEANSQAAEHGFGVESQYPAYSVEVDKHKRITVAHVWANPAGKLDLREHRTLTQALDAGR